ncbi:MAG: hypothetical protein KDB87_21180, partial [Flavobacteriales bacterium]|nr:hypothetical protein [Flavobacteriales bacterium]
SYLRSGMAFRRHRTIHDPGIGLSFDKPVDRLLGADGQFRVDRRGGIRTFRQFFLFLTTVSTATYVLCLVATYLTVILVFGAGYMAVGPSSMASGPAGAVPWASACRR